MGGNNTFGAMLALISFGIFATHDVVVKFLGGQYSAIQIIFFSVAEGERAWEIWRWPWTVRWERLFQPVR